MKLRFEKEESDVQTIDPAPATALVALCAGALIVHGGVAKRQLMSVSALAAGNAAVAAVWHSRRARFVVQLTATDWR